MQLCRATHAKQDEVQLQLRNEQQQQQQQLQLRLRIDELVRRCDEASCAAANAKAATAAAIARTEEAEVQPYTLL